jgi:hypothetical protein
VDIIQKGPDAFLMFYINNRKIFVVFLFMVILFNFYPCVKAELILVEGDVNLSSCCKIYDRFFILYSKTSNGLSEILLKELDLHWNEIQKKKLGINGAPAYLTYFNDRFYVSYTSFEKEGNVRLAEFDRHWNFLRDILVTPTPYDGEIAYQLIPLDDDYLYLFYARNWVNDCGLKLVEFNRYLEQIQETTFISGDVNFHLEASEFSAIFANSRFYIAYKKSHPQKGMDIFLNEYSIQGGLINERCIDRQEKLSPSLFFCEGHFYIAYEGYDEDIHRAIIYVKQYDKNWNLLRKTRIITLESGAPREKAIIASKNNCYLVTISEGREGNKIFLKEINFDLKEDKVRF